MILAMQVNDDNEMENSISEKHYTLRNVVNDLFIAIRIL